MKTLVPKDDRPSQGNGPITTYTMTQEEMEARFGPRKQQRLKPPTPHGKTELPKPQPMEHTMTADEYLRRRKRGEKRSEIIESSGVAPATFYKWLKKWGFKDVEEEKRVLESFGK